MKKKYAAKLLAALLATSFLLSACGDGGTTSTGDTSSAPTVDSSTVSGSSEASTSDDSTPEPTTTGDYGDTGGLTLPLSDQEVTLTWMIPSDVDGLSNKAVFDHIATRTNVRLDMQTVPKASYSDKLNVTLGSGSLPDILSNGGLTLSNLNTFGSQGAFEAVNEHYDIMPNFKRIFVDDPENSWMTYSYADDNENIYTMPVYNLNREVNHGYLYRADIFKKHDIQPWNNQEEFYQTLVTLKELYPNSYPYSSKNLENFFLREGVAWEIDPTDFFYDEATSQWTFSQTSAKFKDMLDFWKKCYAEGLLDPEFMTNTQDSWTAKLTSEQAFITHDWIGRLDLIPSQMAETNPEYDLRYGKPVGPTSRFNSLPKFTAWGASVAKNKNAEVALKLVDYFYSPSGSELFTIGVEGEMFNWGPDNKPVYPEIPEDTFIDIHLLEETYGLWVEGAYLHPDRRSIYYNYSEREQEAQDTIIKNNLFYPIDPTPKYTDDESTELADITLTLRKEGITFAAKYVTDPSYGEEQWNAWLAEAERLGSKQAEEIHNAAQARYNEFLKG